MDENRLIRLSVDVQINLPPDCGNLLLGIISPNPQPAYPNPYDQQNLQTSPYNQQNPQPSPYDQQASPYSPEYKSTQNPPNIYLLDRVTNLKSRYYREITVPGDRSYTFYAIDLSSGNILSQEQIPRFRSVRATINNCLGQVGNEESKYLVDQYNKSGPVVPVETNNFWTIVIVGIVIVLVIAAVGFLLLRESKKRTLLLGKEE